jgi:hypothetical protein
VSAEDEHSGRSNTNKTTENVEITVELIHEDRRQTTHGLADTVRISYGVCQEVLTENLNMCSNATKFVPPTLDKLSKAVAHKLVFEMRKKAIEEPTFISRIIMGDDSWIYDYDKATIVAVHETTITKSKRRRSRFRVQQRACSLFLST